VPDPYWLFWGVAAAIGLGFCAVWTVVLLDCRDLLRDLVRSGTPFR
jgi:hypothetical protein